MSNHLYRVPAWGLLLLFLLAGTASAQGFLSPIPGLDNRQPSYVVLPGGERIDGTVPMASFVNGTLRSMTFKADDGRKLKFKASELAEFGQKPSKLARLAAVSDQVDNPWDLAGADWEGVMQREWVVFQRALLPTRAERYALQQLLNPGFDRRLQVFYDAKAAENDDSVMGISTAPAESYVVVKDGRRSMQVKKSNYRKLFPELFGDCGAFMKAAGDHKPKFGNFAAAVFAYDQLCGPQGDRPARSETAPERVATKEAPPAREAPPKEVPPERVATREAPPKEAPPPKKVRRAGPTIEGSVFGINGSTELPLDSVRIELRPQTAMDGGPRAPADDLVGLGFTDAAGRFRVEELHSPSTQESYPLLPRWTYLVEVRTPGYYIFNGLIPYEARDEPWEFALQVKEVDVTDDTGVIGPDDRSLQRGATRRGK